MISAYGWSQSNYLNKRGTIYDVTVIEKLNKFRIFWEINHFSDFSFSQIVEQIIVIIDVFINIEQIGIV